MREDTDLGLDAFDDGPVSTWEAGEGEAKYLRAKSLKLALYREEDGAPLAYHTSRDALRKLQRVLKIRTFIGVRVRGPHG